MRVRRSPTPPQVLGLPLDSCDMFLLSRLEQPLSVIELAEVSPCDLHETMERLRVLAEHGVVELFFDDEADVADEERSRRTSVAPKPFEREETGVRLRPDLDLGARKQALIGAVVLGRVQLRQSGVEPTVRERVEPRRARRRSGA